MYCRVMKTATDPRFSLRWGLFLHSLTGWDRLDFPGRSVKGKDDWSCHSYIDGGKESMLHFDWTLKINISHRSLRNLPRGNAVRLCCFFSLLTSPHTSIEIRNWSVSSIWKFCELQKEILKKNMPKLLFSVKGYMHTQNKKGTAKSFRDLT